MEALSRGDLVVAAFSGAYGKPRPALVVQADDFATLHSLTLLPLTSELLDAPLLRVAVAAGAGSGLRVPSQVMVDKVTTLPRAKVGRRIGRLDDHDLAAVERSLARFLGLA